MTWVRLGDEEHNPTPHGANMTLNKHSDDHSPNPTRRTRLVGLFVAASALSGVAFGLSTTAEASPPTMITIEYYTDDTYSEHAGLYVVRSCFGMVNELVYGEVTPYFIEDESSCYP